MIERNASRLLFVELKFPDATPIPHGLLHRMLLLGGANPGPHTPATPLDYAVERVARSRAPKPVLEPPLRGDGWAAVNGCCNSDIVHPGSEQSINGALVNSQRYAIDWMRLDAQGQLVHGDLADVGSDAAYGAKVYAVADGTVVGNHVILAISRGLQGFYAHLKKGSITVHVGERVSAGMVIGNLGDTCNTSAAHLHLHVMDGLSSRGSEAVPYVIDPFKLSGQIDVQAFAKTEGLDGQWGAPLPQPVAGKAHLPLNLNIVAFPVH